MKRNINYNEKYHPQTMHRKQVIYNTLKSYSRNTGALWLIYRLSLLTQLILNSTNSPIILYFLIHFLLHHVHCLASNFLLILSYVSCNFKILQNVSLFIVLLLFLANMEFPVRIIHNRAGLYLVERAEGDEYY